jgi:hypothetical protein
MEPDYGLIPVYGTNDDGVTAFSGIGIENLKEFIAIHTEDSSIMQRFRDAIDNAMSPTKLTEDQSAASNRYTAAALDGGVPWNRIRAASWMYKRLK